MVAPISGPFPITEDYQTIYRRRIRWKQRRPFDKVLPYTFLYGKRMAADGNLVNKYVNGDAEDMRNEVLGSTALNQAKILAYDKLKAQLGDRASMAENLIEIEKSLQIIATRGMQLLNFTRAIKRGDLKAARQLLHHPDGSTRKHPVKQEANQWLEYHLGIEPAVKDIFTAIDVLQNPLPKFKVTGKSSIYGAKGGSYTTLASYSKTFSRVYNTIGVKYGCEVAISNPNLYLANALGVINPAVVLWQLIPLSFVLDWFVNVEQFLGTMSDFWGLSTLNEYTSVIYAATYEEYWTTYAWRYKMVCIGMERSNGFSLPSLALRPFKATSWERGLTAISLLIPALKSLDRTGYKPRRLLFTSNKPKLTGHDWNEYWG